MGMDEVVNSKGQITNLQNFNKALFALMESRYKNGMAIQSNGWKGLISNAVDSMSQLFQIMSKPVFDVLENQLRKVVPIMSGFIAYLNADFLQMKDAHKQLVSVFGEDTANKIGNFYAKILQTVDTLRMQLEPTLNNLQRIFTALLPILKMVGAGIAIAFGVLLNILPPILNITTLIIAKLLEWQGFIPLVTSLAAAFVTYKTAVAAVNTVMATYTAVTKIAKAITTAFKVAQVEFAIVGGGLPGIISAITVAMRALNLTMLANPFVWIPALIVAVGVALYELYQHSETFRNGVNALWQGIKDGWAAVGAFFTTTLPQWWTMIESWFMNLVTSITGFFSNLGTQIMVVIQPFLTFFVQSWENMKLLVLGIIEVFIGLITGNFDKVKLGLLAIWTAIKDQALAYWTLLKDTVIALVVGLWNGITTWFSNGKTKVVGFVTSVYNGVVSGFTNAKNGAISAVTGMWNGIVSWVGKIPGKFTEMKNNVVSTVKGINLYEIGKNIVQGLINGLGSMLRSVKNKAHEISQAVEKAIKDKLKISSPSKVTLEIGKNTGEGLVLGLSGTLGSVSRIAATMGQTLSNTIQKSVSTASKVNLGGMFAFTKNDAMWKYLSEIRKSGNTNNSNLKGLPDELQGAIQNLGKSIAPKIRGSKSTKVQEYVQKYLNAIIEDGDYLNDWLTHIPASMRNTVKKVGESFAQFEGLTQKKAIEVSSNVSSGMDQTVDLAKLLGSALTNAVHKTADTVQEVKQQAVDLGGVFNFTKNDSMWKYFSDVRTKGLTASNNLQGIPQQFQSAIKRLGESIAPKLKGLKNTGMQEMLQNYVNGIIQDGNYANDWLTHMPKNMRATVEKWGKQYAPQLEGITQAKAYGMEPKKAAPPVEEHTHYWNVNADEISDVSKLVSVVNGIVQTVRSR